MIRFCDSKLIGSPPLLSWVVRRPRSSPKRRDMNADDSLVQVKRLLGLLPGVTLAWVQKTPTHLRLGLAINDACSLATLAHIVVAANVPMNVEVAWDCPGEHDDPSCVRYDWRVPIEAGPFDPPSELQLVGGMLARKLKHRGLLNAEEADRLLRAWNFALE
jgi:hypothetical protein